MTSYFNGERDLWASVLALAFDDALGNLMLKIPKRPDARKYYLDRRDYMIKDARAWINSDRKDITSFEWVCGVLDIDAERVRKYVNSNEPREAKSR